MRQRVSVRRARILAGCALLVLASGAAIANSADDAPTAAAPASGATMDSAPAERAATAAATAAIPPATTPTAASTAANDASARLTSARAMGSAPDPLFADQSRLELRLEGPIRELIRDKSPDPEDRPALMSWTDLDGSSGSLDIEYRARGKSRRQQDKCYFPPIRLDIPRSAAQDTLFAEQDKLKLVTHCKRLGSSSSEQFDWVEFEYYVYRLLNSVTDYSFRVRPVTVTYVDSDGDEYEHPGFLIEDKDRMAHRLGLELSQRPTISRDQLAPELTQTMEVFQYMIGNTDFSFMTGPAGDRCCHNAVQLTNGESFVPIPYDFDQTGVVNKKDALPAEGLGINRVTDRRYRGICRDTRYLDEAVALYADARGEMARILDEEIQVSDRRKRSVQRFLDRFWKVMDDPDRVQREFVRRCRG